MNHYTKEQSAFAHFFTARKMSAPLWLIVRVYVGWIWLEAAWEKMHNATWVGASAGQAMVGFVQGALAKTGGAHPDVQWWYASFLTHTVLSHPMLWSYLITYGELLVGLGLILGCLTGIAAFFGFFMNLNFLWAGTVSLSPTMLVLSVGLMLAWRVAGYLGGDYFIVPVLDRWCGRRSAIS